MTIVIDKIPEWLWIKEKIVDFNIFAEKFIDYMEDLEDREKVKNEMNNLNDESFDYSLIRREYV